MSSRYQPGQLIRCQGCVTRRHETGKLTPEVISSAPLGKPAVARSVASPEKADPTWFIFFCSTCKTWTEYQTEREVAA